MAAHGVAARFRGERPAGAIGRGPSFPASRRPPGVRVGAASASRRPRRVRRAVAAILLALVAAHGLAQETAPGSKLSLFKDPEDGAFDVSAWAATRTGVIPVVSPITEPAVGLGAAVALALIHGGGFSAFGKAPLGVTGKPVPPDISAVGGAYTENGTWAVLAAHLGFWGGDRWRYTGGAARMSPYLDTYDAQGRGYSFNVDGWALYQELRRRVGRSDVFVGARYVLADSTARFEPDEPPPPEVQGDGRPVRASGLGAVAEYDTRDNIFTPNRGTQIKASATFFRADLGSDHDYDRYTADGSAFWNPDRRLVLAGRLRTQNVRGDEPFYARPYVRLRGIPAMRYQGETAVSLDLEARWGLTTRWWLVGFGGAGWTDAGSVGYLADESVIAGGVGFRYLVARLLGLQMGLDVAKGPEDWATYVVFGSSW
jgi:hypothetical protein